MDWGEATYPGGIFEQARSSILIRFSNSHAAMDTLDRR